MFESIGRSFALVKTSWDILMDDKKLLVFPLLSGIVSLIVLLTFALPLILTGSFMSNTGLGPVMFYGLLFVFYAVSYFVVIFFNTALITCVNARLNGKDATIGDGLSNATRHIGSILAWALISATVGLILQVLEDKAGFIGQIAATLIGGAWGLVTFFVVPILILEDKGVVDSVKDSVSLIKKTWGESIVGGGSIFLVFLVIGIIAAVGIFAIWFVSQSFLLAIALLIIVVAILAVVASAMQGIFVTALYTYARTGTVPSSFNKDLIENAFMPKQGSQQGNI
jgi:MFS family permease